MALTQDRIVAGTQTISDGRAPNEVEDVLTDLEPIARDQIINTLPQISLAMASLN
jgi:hypothetical protein